MPDRACASTASRASSVTRNRERLLRMVLLISWLPSRPREFHPEPLTDSGRDTLVSSGSCHRSKAAAFRREFGAPPVASWLAPNVGDLPPSLHEHYTRFITNTGQSAPLRRIGTFSLA